jgi:hypothetical protein
VKKIDVSSGESRIGFEHSAVIAQESGMETAIGKHDVSQWGQPRFGLQILKFGQDGL